MYNGIAIFLTNMTYVVWLVKVKQLKHQTTNLVPSKSGPKICLSTCKTVQMALVSSTKINILIGINLKKCIIKIKKFLLKKVKLTVKA